MENETPNIPSIPVPDLSQLKEAQMFDPRTLPDAMAVEFSLVDYSWFVDEVIGGGHRARFEFFTPMLPFIKFSIPWSKEALTTFKGKVDRALEVLDATENIAAEGIDNGNAETQAEETDAPDAA